MESKMNYDWTDARVVNDADAAQPKTTSRRRSPLLFALAIVLGILVLAIVFTSRVSFRHLLEEFSVAPSPLTSFALGGFLPAILGLVLIATVAKERIPASPGFKNSWNAVAVGVTLACLVAYVVGIFAPLVSLIESLS